MQGTKKYDLECKNVLGRTKRRLTGGIILRAMQTDIFHPAPVYLRAKRNSLAYSICVNDGDANIHRFLTTHTQTCLTSTDSHIHLLTWRGKLLKQEQSVVSLVSIHFHTRFLQQKTVDFGKVPQKYLLRSSMITFYDNFKAG